MIKSGKLKVVNSSFSIVSTTQGIAQSRRCKFENKTSVSLLKFYTILSHDKCCYLMSSKGDKDSHEYFMLIITNNL